MIDLHVHSTFSDGSMSPTDIIHLAKEKGIEALALTDHDTFAGIREAQEAAQKEGLELIPGIELSTDFDGQEVHVVGLYMDVNNQEINQAIEEFRYTRDHRNEQIIEKLQEHGFDITMEALLQENKDAVITRANIARFLVDHKQIGSINHVFERYLGDDCCCYVSRKKITPMEACSLIRNAGGIPILAHPVLYHLKEVELCQLIEHMLPYGLKGIEVFYSTYDKGNERSMQLLANKYHLLASGGSDFHGDNKPYIHLGTGRGTLNIPYSILEKIKKELPK